MKVLHITTHMGGGVGKFLSATVCHAKNDELNIEHQIILLEKPEKTYFVDCCLEKGIETTVLNNDETIIEKIKLADIVIIHWWHNPVMAKLLALFPSIPVRLVIWSHISGCNYPAIPFEFTQLPHKMFFTTPYSYENPYWDDEQRNKIQSEMPVVYGLGAEYREKNFVKPQIKQADTFRIGYVGTLSASKIHPDFIEYCRAVIELIPTAKFIFIGDITLSKQTMELLAKYNIERYFEFIGYTNEVDIYLASFDVFGYPLNPYHFGTTENVVLEAMAMGLPVVALNQNTEKYIIEHRKDGLLADNINDYAKQMKYLFDYQEERIRLGKNAQEKIINKFNLTLNIEKMYLELTKVMLCKKKIFDFAQILGDKPYLWFLACLGANKDLFLKIIASKVRDDYPTLIKKIPEILLGQGKSSISHFAEKYPEDDTLRFLNLSMKKGREK